MEYNKRKKERNQNEKDKIAKRQSKRPKKSTIDKQE
jgi:hypothetical protein